MTNKEVDDTILTSLALILILIFASGSYPQGKRKPGPVFEEPREKYSFDEALVHRHGELTTVRAEWKDRTIVEAKLASAYLLGNAFFVRMDEENKNQMFYRIWALEEQPMISELSSRYPTYVEIQYDPICRYAVIVKNVTPPPIISLPPPGDKPPRPKPQPTPKPKRETKVIKKVALTKT